MGCGFESICFQLFVHQSGKMVLAVDSGARDSVVPPSVCSLAPLRMTNKVGVEYQVANGAVIENL